MKLQIIETESGSPSLAIIAPKNKANPNAALIDWFNDWLEVEGWRFWAPWRCICCGIIISRQQFSFSMCCGGCDLGKCNHLKEGKLFSGVRLLIDAKAAHRRPPEKWYSIEQVAHYNFPPKRYSTEKKGVNFYGR